MLKADKDDRLYVPDKPSRRGWVIALVLVVAAVGAYFHFGKERLLAFFETGETIPADALAALYQKWGVEPLPGQVLASGQISRRLAKLSKEPCDWQTFYPLTQDLRTADYRREAATILVGYSHNCSASNVALYEASDTLLGLGDVAGALKISDELIAMSGNVPQFYFSRGLILQGVNRHEEAIDAFYSTIGLTDDLKVLNSRTFVGIASSQAALGNFCEAIEPLQTWLSIDPSERDTVRLRKLMTDYASKGNCQVELARGTDRFAVSSNDVIQATVEINGVRGRFIVDTGASLVTLTSAFAGKIALKPVDGSPVVMQTANGIAEARRSSVKLLRLGKVSAQDVAVIILQDGKAPLGPGIDGLLGRSFLSRFDVTIGKREWSIAAK